MNDIITKCITELKTEKPRIDYVLGMLETVAALGATPGVKTVPMTYLPPGVPGFATPSTPIATSIVDEGAMLDGLARAGMAQLEGKQ